jgi:phage gp46-like protein
MSQQGDVLLCQTNNNGDISVVGGVMTMTPSFETALYLSLYGANEDDDGTQATDWWGNIDENLIERQYHSNTQRILEALTITSGNLLKVEDAVKLDLQWFLDTNIASSIDVSASVPALNKVKIEVVMLAEGVETSFEFTENWKASK